LLARVHALLRRTLPGHDNSFSFDKLKVNFESRRVTISDEELTLTPTEFKLLEALIKSKGRVLSRRDLLDIVWGMDSFAEEHTVNVNIKRLRDKLGEFENVIQTVKGVGYRLGVN